MKKPVNVSALTFDLWIDFVQPSLRDANMLEEVLFEDEKHEFTAEVIDAEIAEEIAHCMTIACFNAHSNDEDLVLDEAKQMLSQLDVSLKYRPDTAEAITILYQTLTKRIAETEEDTEGTERMEDEPMNEVNAIMKELAEYIRIQEQAAEQVEALKDQLKERMKTAGVDTIQGDEHKAVYRAVTSNRLDTAALKKELPDVAKRYTVTTESMRFTFN